MLFSLKILLVYKTSLSSRKLDELLGKRLKRNILVVTLTEACGEKEDIFSGYLHPIF
jgi:hypothetical protein